MKQQICVRCKKKILGKIKIESRIKKVGKNTKQEVDYYCEGCFLKRSEEKAKNAHRKKEAADKRKNNRRTRKR